MTDRCSTDDLSLRREGDLVRVGVSESVRRILTWVTAVELPAPGVTVAAGDHLATVDSQKAAIALQAPVALEVVEANGELASNPMLVRLEAEGRGWLVRARIEEADWRRLVETTAEVLRATRLDEWTAERLVSPYRALADPPNSDRLVDSRYVHR